MSQKGKTDEVVKTGQEIAANFLKPSKPLNIYSLICRCKFHKTVEILWKHLDTIKLQSTQEEWTLLKAVTSTAEQQSEAGSFRWLVKAQKIP